MHKLYSAKYILISDGSNDIFASDLLFLEGEPTKHLDSFGTFYEFYDAVASCKYPWRNQCSFINHSLNFMDLLTGFLRQKISKHLFLLKRSTKNIPPRIITLISSKKTCLWTTLSSFCRSITLSEATLNESYFCSKRP